LAFTIASPGLSSPAQDLALTASLPAGMILATPASPFSSCGGVLSAPDGGTTLSLTGGAVGAASSCTISVLVTANTDGAASGTLNWNGNVIVASANLTVATDRPGFSKSFAPAVIPFGGRSTVRFTIDNTANTNSAYFLSFTDSLPSGMVITSPAVVTTTCSGGIVTANAGGSSISLSSTFGDSASIGAGALCSIEVDVLAHAVGNLTNTTGELTSTPSQFGGSSQSSGMANAALTVVPEQLSLTSSFTDDPVAPGDTVTLAFTIRNFNRGDAATDITFTDDLDATLSGLTALGLPLADPCGGGSVLSGTSSLSLSGGNLAAEGICSFDVTLQVPTTAPSGSFGNTTSAVTANVNGSQVPGEPASDTLFVTPAPRLSKTFLDNPVGAGSSTTLEFELTNTSATESATDIAFEDVFVIELPTASAIPPAGFCGTGSTATFTPLVNTSGSIPASLVVAGASLDPGASCTFALTLDVATGAAAGTYGNTTSSVTAQVGGETVVGSGASDDLQVVAAPRLIKEFTNDPVIPGDTVILEFTLVHNENAPADALDISFSDDLAAALPGLQATGLPLTDVCGAGSTITGTQTLLLTGGSLTPGASCTFAVTLMVPSDAPAGTHTNTTSAVTATVGGVTATSIPAINDLAIAGLVLSKEFVDNPVLPGQTVVLHFTIANNSPVSPASGITFTDNLDAALDGLVATSLLPISDPCGAGSTLAGLAGNHVLSFSGGTLGATEQCSFDVDVEVPASAVADTYGNVTSLVSATIDNKIVLFDAAIANLTVVTDVLQLSKEFVDDPVGPGDPVTLRFRVENLHDSLPVADIAFTDDLDAALTDLVSSSGTLTDICGVGSQLSGVTMLTLSGGQLSAGTSCTFDVSLMVPPLVPLGTVVTNTTSAVTGAIGAATVTGNTATDELLIDLVTFSKSFATDAVAGDTVTLSFTIANSSTSSSIGDLSFVDDLDAMIPGLTATSLPQYDVCGAGSALLGTSVIALTGANLLPGGSCTFDVELQVPAATPADTYHNTTSSLNQLGIPVAEPATASLVVVTEVDDDEDGVLDDLDACLGTVIPESVPTVRLGVNHFALVDDDLVFDTTPPNGTGPGLVFTTTDTRGCSCEQIIDALGLGKGHEKFGCSISAMLDWVELVGPAAAETLFSDSFEAGQTSSWSSCSEN